MAKRYGLSRITVTKWRASATTSAAFMDPNLPCSTMLSMVEEALVIEFRRRKLTCPHKNGLSVM